jgi:3-methyladenine DNA glycosylase AlkD
MPKAESRSLLLQIIDDLAKFRVQNTAALRAVRRQFSRQLRGAESRMVLRLAFELQKAKAVHRFFSDELIANHKGAMALLKCRDLERLGAGMNGWDQVDCFATILSGPAWRAGQISDSDIGKWARSRDRWWRRAALVSTVRLNVRGTKGDATRTLRVCELLLDDRDDMVVKAMSWALRELVKRDSKSVEVFIQRYSDRLAPRVIREVGNKLRTGLKNPRRKP